ncbi:MAG: hypothetical protein HW380_210 [Magnetococcales bacterium]|nr:hypothetical protein [Magnetococcales bacterium]HIJ83832.1 hypothetical protein [Magnetococcales bacterium]
MAKKTQKKEVFDWLDGSRPGRMMEALAQEDSRRLWLAEVDLGLQCQRFFNSDVGRYLLGRAAQEIQEARDLLEQVHHEETGNVRQLQNRIWRARSFITWIDEAIRDGEEAEINLSGLTLEE